MVINHSSLITDLIQDTGTDTPVGLYPGQQWSGKIIPHTLHIFSPEVWGWGTRGSMSHDRSTLVGSFRNQTASWQDPPGLCPD